MTARVRYFARLARNLSAQHLGTHRARLVLSAVGVASGVALVVAVTSLAASIDASLDTMTAASATRANLEVRPSSGVGIPEVVVSEVQSVAGVEVAGGTIESYTSLRRGTRTARVLLVGLDAGVLVLAPRAATTGVEVVDPTGIVVPSSVARDLGVDPGDDVEVATSRGWKEVRIGGVHGEASPGIDIAAAALPVVQQLTERVGSVDAVYVRADDPARATAQIERVVAGRGRVGPIGIRKQDLEGVIEGTTSLLGGATLVALFVGMLLVHNTMSMAAVERFREAAVLRAIGASRRHVVALFLAEAAVIGAAGALVGLGLGAGIAKVALASRQADIEELFPLAFTGAVLRPRDLVGGAAAGLFVALAAAALPARRIARADPAIALGEESGIVDPTVRSRRILTVVGVSVIVGGVIAAANASPSDAFGGFLGLAAMLLGVALVIPSALPLIARLVATRVERARWSRRLPVTRLAAAELVRSPRRTAFTTAAILLAVTLFVSFAVAIGSFGRAFESGIETWLHSDLYVRASAWRPLGAAVPLDAALADRIRAIPGVHDVYPFRIVTLSIDGEPVTIQTWPFQALSDNIDDLPDDYAGLLRTRGRDEIGASTSYLRTVGADVGDRVILPGPEGGRTFRISASYNDVSAFLPILYVDYDTFTALSGVAEADSFGVFAAPGTDVRRLARAIEREVGTGYDLVVETTEQFKDRLLGISAIQEQLVSLIQGVALVIAGLAVSNTLLISIFQRRREIGVLRAVGMQRGEVGRLITAEAMFMGALGVALGVGVGAAAGYALHLALEGLVAGDVAMRLPVSLLVAAVLLGVGLAGVASLYPARRAAGVNMLTAVKYE